MKALQPLAWLLGLCIRGYQIFIAPLLPQTCRFYPTCSNYALECLKTLPLHLALVKIATRLWHCRPGHEGGYDPL